MKILRFPWKGKILLELANIKVTHYFKEAILGHRYSQKYMSVTSEAVQKAAQALRLQA